MTMIGGDGKMLSRFISAHLKHEQVPISQAGQATQKTFLPFNCSSYKPLVYVYVRIYIHIPA